MSILRFQQFIAINFLHRLFKEKAGGVLVYTAILLPTLLGFVGLGVDVALWHVTKRNTQAIADAAALGGALEIMRVQSNPNIIYAGLTEAERNGFLNDGVNFIAINNPPLEGAYTAKSTAVEVVVRVPSPQFLSRLIDTQNRFISSRAVGVAERNNTCLWSLEPLKTAAISISGGADVEFNCGVFSNSSDEFAISLNGAGSCLVASEIKAVGGVSSGCLTPTPVTGVLPLSDPLATLPTPISTGCTYSGNISLTGHNDATLSPGTYCGSINILTSGTVTFEPGVYYMKQSGINIGSHATVVGAGVTLYMAAGGQVSDNIAISSGSNVNLSAPETGVYSGIVIFQDKQSNPNISHQLTGGAYMDLAGIVYTPNQEIVFAGGSSANSSNTTIISNTIRFTGNSNLSEYTPSSRKLNPLLVEARLLE